MRSYAAATETKSVCSRYSGQHTAHAKATLYRQSAIDHVSETAANELGLNFSWRSQFLDYVPSECSDLLLSSLRVFSSWRRREPLSSSTRKQGCNLLTILLFVVVNGTRKCLSQVLMGCSKKGRLWPWEVLFAAKSPGKSSVREVHLRKKCIVERWVLSRKEDNYVISRSS